METTLFTSADMIICIAVVFAAMALVIYALHYQRILK